MSATEGTSASKEHQNNVLTVEERRTWAETVSAGKRFAFASAVNVWHGGKRRFKNADDPSMPQPTCYASSGINVETLSKPADEAELPPPPTSPPPPPPPAAGGAQMAPTRDEMLTKLLAATDSSKALDVLVVGGGITGTGIALDLAVRAAKTAEGNGNLSASFSVGLVEANDYASETSSRSSKLIHGGVRYLEKAVFGCDFQQLKLVFEALSERAILVHQSPFLVHPIETIIPCYSFYDFVLFWCGMKTYDLLAILGGGVVGGYSSIHLSEATQRLYPHLLSKRDFGLAIPFEEKEEKEDNASPLSGYNVCPKHKKQQSAGKKKANQTNNAFWVVISTFFSNFMRSPIETSKALLVVALCFFLTFAAKVGAAMKRLVTFPYLIGSVCYFDGQHHDARLCLHVAMTANTYGAACLNHCKLLHVEQQHETPTKLLHKCTIEDRISGKTYTVYARTLVNATGPFSDAVRKMINADHKNKVRPSHGTHITLPQRYAPKDRAMMIPSNDGRVIFCISYLGHCIAGTTDASCAVVENPQAPEEDVAFILNNLRPHLGPIDRSEVLSVWCGIRPLAAPETVSSSGSSSSAAAASQSIVREHSIHVDAAKRVLSITGGKWTTYRKMGHDAVVALIENGLVDADKVMWNDAARRSTSRKQEGTTTAAFSSCELLSEEHSLTRDLVLHGARHLGRYTSSSTLQTTATAGEEVTEATLLLPTLREKAAPPTAGAFAAPYVAASVRLSRKYTASSRRSNTSNKNNSKNERDLERPLIPSSVILHWIQTYGDAVEALCRIAVDEVLGDEGIAALTKSNTNLNNNKDEDEATILGNYWNAHLSICPPTSSHASPFMATTAVEEGKYPPHSRSSSSSSFAYLATVTDVDIIYSARYESCERVQDFVARRAPLAFLNVDVTATFAIERVARVMAAEKGWSEDRTAAEMEDAVAYLRSFVALAA